jgi:hypothetical protein
MPNAVLEQRLVTLSGTFAQAPIVLLGHQCGIDAQGLWATTSHEAMGMGAVSSRSSVDVVWKARARTAGRVASGTRETAPGPASTITSRWAGSSKATTRIVKMGERFDDEMHALNTLPGARRTG